MNIAVLVNPAARAGAHTHAATDAVARLREHGHTTTMISGGSAAESSALLRDIVARTDADGSTGSAPVDAVVVVGGDGTARLALQELAGTGIPFGIVPAGTGNDLATNFGIRELDASAAADVIAAGRTTTVDLARVIAADGTTTYFGTVLASGFDSRVNDRANAMRWPRGKARYNIAILVEFLTLRGVPYRIELELEDGTRSEIAGDLVMATVGNGRTYGGGIPICPDADPTDGLLDVTLVRPAGRLHLLRLLPRVYAGTHRGIGEVSMYRARAVHLSSPGVTAYADGDPIGALPLRVEIAPAALVLFTP